MTAAKPIRMEVASPEFFSTKPERLEVEENAGTGRTYFLKRGRIVAVGIPTEATQ